VNTKHSIVSNERSDMRRAGHLNIHVSSVRNYRFIIE
jgi:hypothetical protein